MVEFDSRPGGLPERRSGNKWHWDKSVSGAVIILFLVGYGISGLFFVVDIKRDVEVLKVQYKAGETTQHDRDARQDVLVESQLSQLRGAVDRANDKLDRLIDRQVIVNQQPRK